MAYYRRCPCCGAYNDPGEVCDCREDKKEEADPTALGTTSGKIPNQFYQGAVKMSTSKGGMTFDGQ